MIAREVSTHIVWNVLIIYMFFMDDLLYYYIQGGGALRVLCKRGIKCYYASVLRLQFKLHNTIMNL